MKKKLIIRDRSKTIYFKNRKVRTPCTLEITNKEFIKLRLSLKMADIQDYELVSFIKKSEKETDANVLDNDKEVVIEEIDFDNNKTETILDKLMNGE